MYLLNEMLLMTPVVLYVGLRLGSLVRGKGGRIVFALFFLGLLPAFPLAEGLARGRGPGRINALDSGGLRCPSLPDVFGYHGRPGRSADRLLRLAGGLSAETLRRRASG